jgi:hypothetical protein
MGVNSGANAYINFGTNSAISNLVQKTIIAWMNVTTLGTNCVLAKSAWWGFYHRVSTYNLYFTQGFNITSGEWYISTAAPTGALTQIAVAYDNSSLANDPIFYLNGAVKSTLEKTTPSGVDVYDTGTDLSALGYPSAGYGLQGIGYDVKLYNRILSAAEILDDYNARCHILNDNGLVFHAMLDGAAGVNPFDGATLAAGNTLADRINGAVGVPSGSPVGVADPYLATCAY